MFVENGRLRFNPCLLRAEEFLKHPKSFHYIDVTQKEKTLQLYRHELVFTYCQVPIVYSLAAENCLDITYRDGSISSTPGLKLDTTTTQKLFKRTGEIESVKVNLEKTILK